MMQIFLDVATIFLLACVTIAGVIFMLRLNKLRQAITEAGDVLPKLDAAVAQMNTASTGFSGRIQTEVQSVDARIAVVKRLLSDMEGRVRDADELALKLENQLRQARKLDQARSRAVPRELAEPKGFAERVERLAAAALPDILPEPLPPAKAKVAISLPDSMPDDFHLPQELAGASPSAAPFRLEHPLIPDLADRHAALQKTLQQALERETLRREPLHDEPTAQEAIQEAIRPERSESSGRTEPARHESPEADELADRLSLMSIMPFNSFATDRSAS